MKTRTKKEFCLSKQKPAKKEKAVKGKKAVEDDLMILTISITSTILTMSRRKKHPPSVARGEKRRLSAIMTTKTMRTRRLTARKDDYDDEDYDEDYDDDDDDDEPSIGKRILNIIKGVLIVVLVLALLFVALRMLEGQGIIRLTGLRGRDQQHIARVCRMAPA